MAGKIIYYERKRGTQSFITVTGDDGHVHVQEWELLTPGTAMAVLAVELRRGRYERLVASAGDDEGNVQRLIVIEARRRREVSIFARHHLPRPSLDCIVWWRDRRPAL